MRIVLIGAGNVATRLGSALAQAGETIVQVYSRSEASAKLLGESLNTSFTTRLDEVVADADVYLFSLKDDVIESVASALRPNKGLWVHTSGSIPISIFEGKNDRYGVFYPLQTFSREREVNFREIPCFVESNSSADEQLLKDLAGRISDKVLPMTSERRKFLHLAAVFACNFTNHLYQVAEQLLEENEIPGDLLLPLIDETARKVHFMKPKEAQTGPAVRNDRSVIEKHLALLKDSPELQNIYEILSQNIYKTMNHE